MNSINCVDLKNPSITWCPLPSSNLISSLTTYDEDGAAHLHEEEMDASSETGQQYYAKPAERIMSQWIEYDTEGAACSK